MLTPLDIRQKEFNKNLRGYDRQQVSKFLNEVVNAMEDLLRENDRLKQQLADCEGRAEKYREIEEALKNTLIMAQKQAQDLKENTDKEIKLIMQETNQRVEKMIQQAEKDGQEKITAAENQVQEIMEKHRETQKQVQVFRNQFRTFLEVQLDLLSTGGNSLGNIEAAKESHEERCEQ
ncbi:MAG: DivIVA domain-containing protein [Desulfotomaculum sp.]|nr:DivIVA domain-containing protein [Desulfotomaculum sp.]